MKKTGMMWGLCVAMGLSAISFAGERFSSSVFVNTTTRAFSGNLGTARNSSDGVQYLWCSTVSTGAGFCYAKDASGVAASCSTSDAEMVATIRALNSDSNLQVSYDSTGTCTFIWVSTGSHFETKGP
ncbi:hypothetical protein [Corallococcus carmarthensis]|uniref:Uncharacterized protein n=1 Tax=Corallococcus carmarthensis TaxID=2316728 RepID=A0A3A8K853_9BACT|nr:hypothetical protein [Corallococcus carmarthensis]NOK17577.1 hypothetical protein [Corallococcus carmarthensis]RKH00341.1 hypothetical protein D7X32_23700 [Corallococcus carmarthensis]